jgi:hypothetical protein
MEAIKKNLKAILDTMDVPEMRKDLTPHNLRWLGRNLAIRNSKHDSFPCAIHFIKTLLYMGGDTEPLVVLGQGDNWQLTEETITPQKAAELLGQEPPLKEMNRSQN